MTRIDDADRATLLGLAHAAIEAEILGRDRPEVSAIGGALSAPGAAFVTVHVDDDLRGCLGCVEPRDTSLAAAVVDLAAAAATSDPRFPPIGSAEVPRLHVEISLLGPLEPVASPDDIVIGRHGLVVEQGALRGLLLPQVAARWGWSVRQFLAETCRKAGLPSSAWQTGADVQRFEAQVFADPPASRLRVR